MAVREFEAWLLISELRAGAAEGRSLEQIRDAKGRLSKVVGGYTPAIHQSKLAERIDIDVVRTFSDSFDKLVRTLADLFEAACPPRPPSQR